MMVVTSGAVAYGKQRLRGEMSMQQTLRQSLNYSRNGSGAISQVIQMVYQWTVLF